MKNQNKQIRKPTSLPITKKSDLENLIPGDSFQLAFNPRIKNTIGIFVTYEGKVGDKIAVMLQDIKNPEKYIV